MNKILLSLLFTGGVFMGNISVACGQTEADSSIIAASDSLLVSNTINDMIGQNVVMPKMPQEASFAGEVVPLQYFDVYESLQREIASLTYQHGTMIYIAQLQNRYKERIVKILEEEGIPGDFFYLCIAESMLQPLASPAGAKGYWQFMDGTAKEYGLEVSPYIDERYNWDKSTRAAAKYFKKAYEKYGTWTLAAASYNIGMNNVDNRKQLQGLNNYYDMQFPVETARYVYRAVAFKTILNNLKDYGFNLSGKDMYKPIETKRIKVTGSVSNWSVWAAGHNTNFKMIKMLNEWIRSNRLDNKTGKTYFVEVPAEGARIR